MPLSENKQRMQRGELYHAFTDELVAERTRCTKAVNRFNDDRESTRRHRVELWRDIIQDPLPLPSPAETSEEDSKQFDNTDPWIEPPLHADYGYNLQVAASAYINFNATFVDTCVIKIGARTLIGPNCSFYSGTHPLDPVVRNGTKGPEGGAPIEVGEDVWLGGNVTVLPGVKIGKGATVGAGSVVTKNIPAFHVVAGNPARIIRKVETEMDPDNGGSEEKTSKSIKRLSKTKSADLSGVID